MTILTEMLDATHAWQLLTGIHTNADADRAGLTDTGDGGRRWNRPADRAATELAELYHPLCLAGPDYALAQMGQTADGFIAPFGGERVFVTGETDRTHLHRLRALVDAVLVGAGTAVADDPRLTVRACGGANPVRVVLDPRGRVPADRHVFTDGAAPTLLILGADTRSPGPLGASVTEVLRLPIGDGTGITAARLLATLRERGLGRVLVEGGGVTVSRFLRERALHRLYLTVSRTRLGGGVPGLRGELPGLPGDSAVPIRRFPLGEDMLLEHDLAGIVATPPPEDQHHDPGQRGDDGQHAVDDGDLDPRRRT